MEFVCCMCMAGADVPCGFGGRAEDVVDPYKNRPLLAHRSSQSLDSSCKKTQAVEYAQEYGPQAISAWQEYGPTAIQYAQEYGPQAIQNAQEYGPQAISYAQNYGPQAIQYAQEYGPQAIQAWQQYGNQLPEAITFAQENAKYIPQVIIEFFIQRW